jgi:hypothetical protein
MTIKGKGKTRRRVVASGPKPAYVTPPKPFWRHPAFITGVVAILVVGIALGVYAILTHIHNQSVKDARRADRAKERVIVTEFSSQVRQPLVPITQLQLNTLIPFPELSDISAKIKQGKPLPPDLAGTGRDNAKLAGLAFDRIQKIDVATLINGHPRLLPLIDSQDYLVQSLQAYQQAGEMFQEATKLTGEGRARLLSHAKALLPVGSALFRNGYQKLVNVETALGIPPPQAPPPQPTPAPSPTPTASASPSGTATPSAKASGGKKGGPSPSASSHKKKKK